MHGEDRCMEINITKCFTGRMSSGSRAVRQEVLITASSQALQCGLTKSQQQILFEDSPAICSSSGLITPVEAAEAGEFSTKLCRWHTFAVVGKDS